MLIINPCLSYPWDHKNRREASLLRFSCPPIGELFQWRQNNSLMHWEVARECKTDSQFTAVFSRHQLSFHTDQSVFFCDTNNQAIRLISSLNVYKFLGDKLGPFIELFQIKERSLRKASVQSSLEDGFERSH